MRTRMAAAWGAVAALAFGQGAVAQDTVPVSGPASEPAAAEPPAASRQVKEIIVTAQKTAQDIQYVPVSISVVDAQFVQEAGLTGLEQITRFTPNVNFDENDVANVAIAMRGFGTPPLGVGLEPSVGLVVDDVPYGRSTYAQDAVFDIDRLEVLRGPQGTLFGKNTIAGVLNFATVAPSMTPGGFLAVTVEEPVKGRRVEGAYTIPLVDDVLAARVAVRYGKNDLGIRNTTRDETNHENDVAARVRFLWHATQDVEFSAGALYSRVKNYGISNQVTKSTERAAYVFRTYDEDFDDDPYDGESQISSPTFQERSVEAYSLKGEWSPPVDGLERLALTSIASYSRALTPTLTDAEFSPIPLGTASTDGDNPYQQATLEIRVAGALGSLLDGDHGLDFVGGVFGQRSRQVARLLFHADDNYTISYFAAGAEIQPSQAAALVPLFPPEALGLLDQALGPIGAPEELAVLLNTLSHLQLFPPSLSTESFVAQSFARSRSLSAFGQFTWHPTERLDVTAGVRIDHADERAADYSERLGGSGVATLLVGQRSFDFPDLHKKKTNVAPKFALGYNWTDDVTTFAAWAKGFKSGVFDTSPLDPGHIDIKPEEATSI
ncbi:MAG TPA: TonB-dependent receptor, partial [Nevskiaceae bacterium]|nr:TonB-dependent receptor [Nevskiaceae bacterium]